MSDQVGVIDEIALIEELAANAWPAEINQALDGWRLRFNVGVTSRANSVWANADGGRVPLAERLDLVEDFYTRHGIPPCYQVTPAAQPADLDAVLADRGYTTHSFTLVEAAALAPVAAASLPRADVRVDLADRLSDDWLAVYQAVEAGSDHALAARQGILRRIGPRAGYALARLDGIAVGVALGVVERGWLGVFCMGTLAAARRRGVGASVLGALAAWALGEGASQAYLQVVAANAVARALYESVGFAPLYEYHYRQRRARSP